MVPFRSNQLSDTCSIQFEGIECFTSNGDNALLIAFSFDADHFDVAIDVAPVQPDKLAYPQPARIEHLQHGTITEPGGSIVWRCFKETKHIVHHEVGR